MQNVNNETLLMIFVALTGAAVLLQAIVLLAMFFALRKTAKTMQAEISDLRSTITPVVNDTKDFLTRVGPKIDAVATDLVEIAHGLRTQGEEMQASAAEILERVRRQTGRLDVIATGFLDGMERAGAIVTQALNVPLRQINAVAAFAKALIGGLRAPVPQNAPRPTHSAADKDLFV